MPPVLQKTEIRSVGLTMRWQRRSQDSCLGGGTRPMPPATFSVISGSRPDSVGGGGSSRNFPGHFFTFPGHLNVTTSIHCRHFFLPKVGGGLGPRGPLATPLCGGRHESNPEIYSGRRRIQKIPNAMRLTWHHRYQRMKTNQQRNHRLKTKQRRYQQP